MSVKEKRKRFFHFTRYLPGLKGQSGLPNQKRGGKLAPFSIDKRQKFVVGTILLSLGLFFTEYRLSASGIIAALLLSVFTNLFLFWAIHKDIRENKTYEVFILPFFYSLHH